MRAQTSASVIMPEVLQPGQLRQRGDIEMGFQRSGDLVQRRIDRDPVIDGLRGRAQFGQQGRPRLAAIEQPVDIAAGDATVGRDCALPASVLAQQQGRSGPSPVVRPICISNPS
jgi:hypothetical protein